MVIKCIIQLIILSALSCSISCDDIFEVTDVAEAQNLIENEKLVVVLYAPESEEKKSSDSSGELETQLLAIREDIVDTLGAWVIKVTDVAMSQRVFKSDVHHHQQPFIAYYRQRVPMLYFGPNDDEVLYNKLLANREICSRSLTDNNFEHLTQASTGATTGDWFIMFYTDVGSSMAEDGKGGQNQESAVFESVACDFKHKMSMARLNKGLSGAVTGRRFNIKSTPSFVLIHRGKMYRYGSEEAGSSSSSSTLNIRKLSDFLSQPFDGGKIPSEDIPQPKSAFDDLFQLCADFISDNLNLCIGVASSIFALTLFLTYIFMFSSPSSSSIRSKSKSSRSKSKSKSKSASSSSSKSTTSLENSKKADDNASKNFTETTKKTQ